MTWKTRFTRIYDIRPSVRPPLIRPSVRPPLIRPSVRHSSVRPYPRFILAPAKMLNNINHMDVICRQLINEICLVFPAILSMIGYIMWQQIEYV